MKKTILLIASLLILLNGSQTLYAALIQYTYDGLNRLTKVDYGRGIFISFIYDEIGNLTRVIANGKPVVLGDIDNDGNVTLTDVVLGLQLATGQEPSGAVTTDADINGDGKIGMEEVLHALQKFSGER